MSETTNREMVCAHVLDIELAAPVGDLQRTSKDGRYAEKAWVLAKLQGEALGLVVLDIPAEGLGGESAYERLIDAVLPRLGPALGIDSAECGRDVVCDAIQAMARSAYRQAHDDFITRATRCSVVICTRDRPAQLRRALASLRAQDHPNFAVWVVDNAPTSDATRQVVESFTPDMDVRYVLEPRPGLSRARNAALRCELEGDVVAWFDDDEIADPEWLSELMRAFDGRPDVVAASGMVVPAELDTLAQMWFEQFGGHSKGRGFTVDWFSPATWKKQHPFFPLPLFGTGASMAFRIDTLRQVGGFDEALGAGTLTGGGEDTKILTDVLLTGGTAGWWPTAISRHFHRRDFEELREQLVGYGAGLTAFYAALIWAKPAIIFDLFRLAPRALHALYSPDSLRVATLEEDFPRSLLAQNRRNMLAGPWLYVRAKIRNWRMDRRG